MPLRNYLLGVMLGKVGIRSIFWALVFLVVTLILGESLAQLPLLYFLTKF